MKAAQAGHTAIVQYLIENAAVQVDTTDNVSHIIETVWHNMYKYDPVASYTYIQSHEPVMGVCRVCMLCGQQESA